MGKSSFALLLFSCLLFHQLRDPLQVGGVDAEPSWRGIGGLVPPAKPQSHQQVWGSQRHAQLCLSATGNKIAPSTSTIDQAPHESQVGVWISDVELVISELASKMAGDVRFQVADVSALVYQVGRPDAY